MSLNGLEVLLGREENAIGLLVVINHLFMQGSVCLLWFYGFSIFYIVYYGSNGFMQIKQYHVL